MHHHPPRARPVRQPDLELVDWHLAYKADRLEHVIITGVELGRRQDWTGLLAEPQKLDDVADDLGEDKTVVARDHRNRARTEPPQLLETAIVRQYVYRLELDPTDREIFLNPEAAGSMRLPKNLDRFAHRPPSGYYETDAMGACSRTQLWRVAGAEALRRGKRNAYSQSGFLNAKRRKR